MIRVAELPPRLPQQSNAQQSTEAVPPSSFAGRAWANIYLYGVYLFNLTLLVLATHMIAMLAVGFLASFLGPIVGPIFTIFIGINLSATVIALDHFLGYKHFFLRLLFMLALTYTGFLISFSVVNLLLLRTALLMR